MPRLTGDWTLPDSPARHRKPSRQPPESTGAPSRRPTLMSAASALRHKSTRVMVAAVTGLALLIAAVVLWLNPASGPGWIGQADALGLRVAGLLGVQISEQTQIVSTGLAAGPGYLNPLREVNFLVPERIDQGVDFSGAGPVYALGNGVVVSAIAYDAGWEGGWVTYQLTSGADEGLVVYVAEDIRPTVQVGQQVTSSTVVGNMYEGGGGIETGWAQPSGGNAESQLSVAGGINGGGPFPTMVGLNFDELLISLGVPAAPNRYQQAFGLLPANYPQVGG
jgi:hypothetical protein